MEITHTSPFYLVLRKEYFVLRETLKYITFNRGGRGGSVLLYSVLLHGPLCKDSDKSPKVGLLLIFSISLVHGTVSRDGFCFP